MPVTDTGLEKQGVNLENNRKAAEQLLVCLPVCFLIPEFQPHYSSLSPPPEGGLFFMVVMEVKISSGVEKNKRR